MFLATDSQLAEVALDVGYTTAKHSNMTKATNTF